MQNEQNSFEENFQVGHTWLLDSQFQLDKTWLLEENEQFISMQNTLEIMSAVLLSVEKFFEYFNDSTNDEGK